MDKFHNKEDYNSEPVFYCGSCKSLNIRIISNDLNYCDTCGCTQVKESSIEDWQNLTKNE